MEATEAMVGLVQPVSECQASVVHVSMQRPQHVVGIGVA